MTWPDSRAQASRGATEHGNLEGYQRLLKFKKDPKLCSVIRHLLTLAQLQERIAQTVTFLDTIKPEQIDGSEAKEIKFSIKEWNFEFVRRKSCLGHRLS